MKALVMAQAEMSHLLRHYSMLPVVHVQQEFIKRQVLPVLQPVLPVCVSRE